MLHLQALSLTSSNQLIRRSFSINFRSMSGTNLHRFVLYAPDYTDAGALQRRLDVRAQHMKAAKGLYDKGLLQIGGGVLHSNGLEASDVTQTLTGSMLIYRAESIEEARKLVESDIYWTSNVWDKERAVITPFLQAKFD
ncbi:hypothetical protein BU17DRAFT_51976 [Hysterangium stoloniferum]|nr:hypothetical protein BU17DRAFT_51976 [Hysterangium stoloniferum]